MPRPGAPTPDAVAPRDQRPFRPNDPIPVPPVVRERLRRLAEPEGAQVKVNLLLTRLPRLRDAEVAPEAAFAGTFHINELESQLDAAFRTAARGGIPSPLPCEIYCHTLSDPSILAPELAASGAHTLTVFGLHVPHRLLERYGNDELRERLQAAVLDSLDSVLAEPIADVIATDAAGRPCIETKTTLDLEEALRHARRQHLPRAAVVAVGGGRRDRSRRPPSAGASRRGIRGSSCADRAPCAAAPSAASAATTRRWPCSRSIDG